jgi:tetratricopeptide (TPR) repeat protein
MLARAIAAIPAKAKEAEPLFRRALALDPRNAELHYEFGRYYQRLGMPSRALAELKAALRLDPGLSKARSAVVELKRTDESPITKSLKRLFS